MNESYDYKKNCLENDKPMFFDKEEKVFSLTKSDGLLNNLTSSLLEEFYCLLVIAGLYREGEGVAGIHHSGYLISDKSFGQYMFDGSYNQVLGLLIFSELKMRFDILRRRYDLTEQELHVLTQLDHVFEKDKSWLVSLTGQALYAIALSRNFSERGLIVARYVSVMYGRAPHCNPMSVPQLYLSHFGDIYLSRVNTFLLGPPALVYGSKIESGDDVTPLWSLMSCLTDHFCGRPDPGNELAEVLTSFSFLSNPSKFEGSVPVPTYASSLYIQRLMGIEEYNKIPVSASFYQNFLYGSIEQRALSRSSVLNYILDLMGKKTGSTSFTLFSPNSIYRKLYRTSVVSRNKQYERPAFLTFALEALDDDGVEGEQATADGEPKAKADSTDATSPTSDKNATDDTTTDITASSDDPTSMDDPSVDDGVDKNTSLNTIGLVSFDKTGEGVDEHLYRRAVVALNDRLRNDNTLPISAETREALDYWVNGFLYLTAISSTKSYITALHLQKFLKKF